MSAPPYFGAVRGNAEKRWIQLEADPELAGPWRLLFSQVQSPRHVLSELLQNADDAGATEAWAGFDDGAFVFRHNGGDFTEDHFASLCRFAFSNKTTLHTIGFRGIGFKSVFSLGDTVELNSPTLSVSFHARRFTLPEWDDDRPVRGDGLTEVRVRIADQYRRTELESNLGEWQKSPLSVLFFRNLQKVTILDKVLHWKALDAPRFPRAQWMALEDQPDRRFLVLRSDEVEFPPDAVSEIRQERNLNPDSTIPPCAVEIVLGPQDNGRLHVVLPTGVRTPLPFACNAPFIQDPAREKIKDPATSPTNRWLLDRAGELAAGAMLDWLGQDAIPPEERADAYDLLPDLVPQDVTLENSCAKLVRDRFFQTVAGTPLLLAENGELKGANGCVPLPKPLYEVWPANYAAALFDAGRRPALSRHVSNPNRKKLLQAQLTGDLSKERVYEVLKHAGPQRPEDNQALFRLWRWLAEDMTSPVFNGDPKSVHVVPVTGKDTLYPAGKVLRLQGDSLSPEDQDFLGPFLRTLDQEWVQFLDKSGRDAEADGGAVVVDDNKLVKALMETLGLSAYLDAGSVIARLAGEFFARPETPREDCVHIAQIAARLNAKVGDSFKFVTRDDKTRPISDAILYDPDGALGDLFPDKWMDSHSLHPDYSAPPLWCTHEEWRKWSASERSGLLRFAAIAEVENAFFGLDKLQHELRRRGYSGTVRSQFARSHFAIFDRDFDKELWDCWERLGSNDDNVWVRIMDNTLAQSCACWSKALTVDVMQYTTGNKPRHANVYDRIPAAWVVSFRDKPCLRDTKGFVRKPIELFLRTEKTEAFLDVEPFVEHRLDTPVNRELLLLLGVRDTPTGPAPLLERLRALAQAAAPPVYEVEKWYAGLDKIVRDCSTEELSTVRQAFQGEKLVLAEGGGWFTVREVFLTANEDEVPGVPLIRATMRSLQLWTKIGVADRPTVDLALQWLGGLSTAKPLSAEEARRVRALLARHASRVWVECGHWITPDNHWVWNPGLKYALLKSPRFEWKGLFPGILQKTADLSFLEDSGADIPSFAALESLAVKIDVCLDGNPERVGDTRGHPWLNRLGQELARVVLKDDEETQRVREIARRLEGTAWCQVGGLKTVPMLNGTPAGEPKKQAAAWIGKALHVECSPLPRLAKPVCDELCRVFSHPDIEEAIRYCYERSPGEVAEYLDATLKLGEAGSTPVDTGNAEPVDEPETFIPPEEPPEIETIPPVGPTEHIKMLTLMARFALAMGFKIVPGNHDLFLSGDGWCIVKEKGRGQLWRRISPEGEIAECYWAKAVNFPEMPLEVPADVWGLLNEDPEHCSFIVENTMKQPVRLDGPWLVQETREGRIKLYPATYRLVYNDDQS